MDRAKSDGVSRVAWVGVARRLIPDVNFLKPAVMPPAPAAVYLSRITQDRERYDMKPIALITLAFSGVLAACSGSGGGYAPIVDGTPDPQYHSDLNACRSLARNQKQFDKQTLGAAAVGAGTGAVLGELDEDGDALGGAIFGALAGAAAGGVNARERRESIVIECMRGRGHAVVG